MKQDKDIFLEEEEGASIDLNLGKYWAILKHHRKTLLWWTIGGFVLGCIFALAGPRKFTCVSKLAPELSNTATSKISSAASLLGLSATLLGTTDAVYPMVYPDVVHSPEFIVDLFDMPVDFKERKDSVHTTLYDYMENYYGKTPVGRVLFAPMEWFGNLMEKIKPDEDASDSTVYDPYRLTRKQLRVYKTLNKSIDAEIDKKTLVVTIKTSFDNRFLCCDLSRKVNDNLKDYVTRYRTEKAIHDRDYYRSLFEQVRDDYYMAQKRYSYYSDSHQGIISQSALAEKDRLKNDMNLKYQLYSSTAQQLQNAEAKVQLETPVFSEVIIPTTPFKSVNSRKKKALAYAVFGLLVGAVVVLVKHRNEQ